MNVFQSLAQTTVNLLATFNTLFNMTNRIVNAGDNYVQTVERHAEDYNFESKIVSAKRREQIQEKYRLLDPNELQKLREAQAITNPFDNITEEQQSATKTV